MSKSNLKTALVFGATGLIGSHLVKLLVEDAQYAKVVVVARRDISKHDAVIASAVESGKLQVELLELDNLLTEFGIRDALQYQYDDVFCCLGSTMKKAKTKAAFRKVDYDFVYATAQLAKQLAASKYIWVSAAISSTKVPSFHLRLKGEVDRDIANLGLPFYKAVKPSLLMGHRDEFRPAESYSAVFFKPLGKVFLHGPLKQFRAIDGEEVAKTMHALCNDLPCHDYLAIWPG